MGNSPTLTPQQFNFSEAAQFRVLLQQAIADLRVSIPAIVQSVDYSKNPPVVTAQIAIKEILKTATGPVSTAIWPISNVPIALCSAGGFSFTLPVQAGDEGLLVFSDMCFDLWWARGGVQDQFERRRHDVTDCIFIPGPRSQARPIPNWSQNSAQLRTDDGTCYIELAPGGVLNFVAPGGVNINGAVVTSGEVTAKGIPLSAHLHPGVQTGGSNTGEPIP